MKVMVNVEQTVGILCMRGKADGTIEQPKLGLDDQLLQLY